MPVFLWLVLGPRTAVADYWAVGLLIAAGLSDWLDGKIARALNQTSRLGQVLDPAADRLYIAATIVALAVRGDHPVVAGRRPGAARADGRAPRWPCCGAGPASAPCRSAWSARPPRCACSTPSRCCSSAITPARERTLARVIGWAFAIWGTTLYWWAAMLYLVQVRSLVEPQREDASP